MGRIGRDKNGNLAVVVKTEVDDAQFRANIKAPDGADEVSVTPGEVVPFSADKPQATRLGDLLADRDTAKAKRAADVKFDLAKLEAAYNGR